MSLTLLAVLALIAITNAASVAGIRTVGDWVNCEVAAMQADGHCEQLIAE